MSRYGLIRAVSGVSIVKTETSNMPNVIVLHGPYLSANIPAGICMAVYPQKNAPSMSPRVGLSQSNSPSCYWRSCFNKSGRQTNKHIIYYDIFYFNLVSLLLWLDKNLFHIVNFKHTFCETYLNIWLKCRYWAPFKSCVRMVVIYIQWLTTIIFILRVVKRDSVSWNIIPSRMSMFFVIFHHAYNCHAQVHSVCVKTKKS